MSRENPQLLLDTNVWIAYFLGDRPGHVEARELMLEAVKRGVTLTYPMSASKDVFYLVACDFKQRYRADNDGKLDSGAAAAATSTAWACVEHMAELAMAVPCDHTDVWMATKLRKLHSDYEDNLVIAAALRGKADLLVTYDKQLRAHATVAVADPASARAWLDTL